MVDVTGKEIKAGMCVDFEYYNGTGFGIMVCEHQGQLGFMDGFLTKEFYPLSDIDFQSIKTVRITKG